MKDKAASTLMKIKKKAIEQNKSNQLLLQLFCQEEFLRRLQQSKYVGNFVLKGGLFVYTLTNFESRSTVDIDFLLRNLSNEIDNVRKIIEEILQEETENDFVKFQLKNINIINIKKEYTGITLDILAFIKNTRTKISIDIGVGDVVIPAPMLREIPVILEESNSPKIYTYSIETTIAEKLDAIFNLKEYTSRMKDYYDLFYLTYKFNFHSDMLCKALYETFNNRHRDYDMNDFEYVLTLKDNEIMGIRWKAFIKKLNQNDLAFSTVLERMHLFLYKPLCWVFQKEKVKAIWDSENAKWIEHN